MQDFSVRLKSDDVMTRRTARIELAREGSDAVELARQYLKSGVYRLELGALVALSIMSEEDRKKLPRDVLSKVREFTSHSDATIRRWF